MVRDGTGDWVIGYNRFLGNCLIFYVELWGILDGLKLIQRRGHSNVVIHADQKNTPYFVPRKSIDFKIHSQEGESMC